VDAPVINRPVARLTVTNAGATVAGLNSVTFKNVGTTPALVDGQPILPGESDTFTAYYDYGVNVFVRVPSISYSASATGMLRILTQD
jgi:hypothetical protein